MTLKDPISSKLSQDYYDLTYSRYGAMKRPKFGHPRFYESFNNLLQTQENKGLEKYGQTISDYKGGLLALVRHATEELTDLMVYITAAVAEMDKDKEIYDLDLYDDIKGALRNHRLHQFMTVLLRTAAVLED